MRVVYWTTDPSSFDSQDASFSANDANKAKSVGIVESWWAAKSQAGFISLEHDITTFTVQIALEVLARIPADSTLKPQTVGTCLGLTQDQWYSNSTPRNPSATTTSGQTTTSSQTTVNGTPITGDDGSEKVLSKNSVSGFFYGSLASLVVGFAVIVLAF